MYENGPNIGVAKQAEARNAMKELTEAIEQLFTVQLGLSDRLTFLCSPPMPIPNIRDTGRPIQASSDLTNTLRELRMRVMATVDNLNDICNRLEV
jgi:hypothetical protein